MWFLEHESLFGGKRIWLRPGAQQLFGRTKSGEDRAEGKTWKIDNKAVSRKHVMLKVLESPPENGTKLHARSQIEVTDLSCRQGTTVDGKDPLKSQKNGDEITYAKTTLSGTEHTIRLAQGYPPFRLVWQDVVLTHASKETKDSKNRSVQLHALDMKTTSEFQFDKTTHVVTAKRNLPKVLSGLAAGRHIVTSAFLDAIINVAATSVDADQNYVPSKLEEDFDTYWPKEKEYIPDTGAEPNPQPRERLFPDPTRSEIFSGLAFVFLNESQYISLLEPIGCGGGKAVLYEVRPGETTVQEYVDYVHSVAGKKRRARNNQRLPVVTVRLQTYPDHAEEWAANFVSGVDQALEQRSVLQSEFLYVILTKDRASLQRPPTDTSNNSSLAPAPTTLSMRDSTPVSQPQEIIQSHEESVPAEQPARTIPRKRTHRAKTTSRFTGFDDYEPPPKRTKAEPTQMEDVQPATQQPAIQPPASIENDQQSRVVISTETQVPFQEFGGKQEQLDSLFPAAAAIRRERVATRAPSASVEPEPAQSRMPKGAEALERLQRAKAKAEKDINVREQTRLRMKEQEERRKADEETLREALQGIDIAEMRNLAPIEEMELRPRQERATTRGQNQAANERWNPEWNGRKNFKKFRRRGAERGVNSHKVLVTLEEAATKKNLGITDAFFLQDPEPPSRVRDKNKRQNERVEESDLEQEPGFRAPKRNTQTEVINVEDSGPDDEEVPQERTQRSSGRTQRVVETQLDDQTQTQGRKRGASSTAAGQPASKRGRNSRRNDDSSDNEETGLRLKFRSRR